MVHKIPSSLNESEQESYCNYSAVSTEDLWFSRQDTSSKHASPYVSVRLSLQCGTDTQLICWVGISWEQEWNTD